MAPVTHMISRQETARVASGSEVCGLRWEWALLLVHFRGFCHPPKEGHGMIRWAVHCLDERAME